MSNLIELCTSTPMVLRESTPPQLLADDHTIQHNDRYHCRHGCIFKKSDKNHVLRNYYKNKCHRFYVRGC